LTNNSTSISTLVFLRIALGLLGGGDILGNGIYYHWYKDAFSGYTFSYLGFEWVDPLPEPFLSMFFIGGFLLGLAVAFGWRFRITAPLFALAFSYFFLLEKSHYLNHAYLFTWLAWLLVLTPAWRDFSLDVRRNPGEWRPMVPAWTVYVFPALMGLVYFFGGIAKINYDWLVEAMPLHLWLKMRADIPVVGSLLAMKPTAYAMAWGGMLLDLTVAFLLLHKRLRWWALAALVFFHATNHLIFNIGIFPYLSMVLTSMWFEPDWPKRFVAWIGGGSSWARTQVRGWVEGWQNHLSLSPTEPLSQRPIWQQRPKQGLLVIVLLGAVFATHLALPLRHHFFASDVNWSETGHRYSWRMMLRSKQGSGHYLLVDKATGEEEVVKLGGKLEARQYRKMTTHPDMILQYAHYLRDTRAAAGQNVAVYGRFRVRLNGREWHGYIDETVDLGEVEWRWFGDKDWVLEEGESRK
jgi:hypothetical protein